MNIVLGNFYTLTVTFPYIYHLRQTGIESLCSNQFYNKQGGFTKRRNSFLSSRGKKRTAIFLPFQLSLPKDYATKNRKTMRKKINTKNILIMSHLLDDMLFKYLSRAPCAPSTLANVSSMFSSILKRSRTNINYRVGLM